MANEKAIEAARSQLWHCETFKEDELFKNFDVEGKGYLS